MILLNILAFICLLCRVEYGLTLAFECPSKTNKPVQDTQICNGIIDCLDKRDESFELCYNRTCNDEKLFRCTYGGCLDITRKCDKNIDCWDSSDENLFECVENEDVFEDLYNDLEGECEDKFNCKEKCLDWSQVCDGQVDCRDGNDENSTLCSTIDCPYPAFRCLYGGCITDAALCNHIPDCYDASDELPAICLHKMDQDPTTRDDDEQSASPQIWEVKHCKLEDLSGALIAENYVGSTTYCSNATVRDQSVVTLRCSHGHVLIGEPKNICDGETWRYELAKCVPQCQNIGNILHERQCTHQGRLIDCDQSVLPMDTRMVVGCASGHEANEKSGVQVCLGNGRWLVEQELPKCEPICGEWKLKDQGQEHTTSPWMVSIFQCGNEPMFEYRCVATILSHYVVITSVDCFTNKPIKGAPATEPVLYTVAEGEVYGNTAFRSGEDIGYKLHNVSYIHNIERRDGDTVSALALVQLIQPLEFSVRLRPICLTSDTPDKWQTTEDFSQYPKGVPIVNEKSNRYELTEILASDTARYHISAFMEPIRNYIAECQERGNI
ncbi:modular serine protease-like [Drosophila obscura]|uniref:modular serine protease-like n=1 Tax=Drosophila obscura TaxID=7282 RepID=UPI000BA06915|nr:modular serine protease-like [Drosophila obscura]